MAIGIIKNNQSNSNYDRHTSYKKIIDMDQIQLEQKDIQSMGLIDLICLKQADYGKIFF